MIALACFVVPVSAAVVYAIDGLGGLIADLVCCAVLLPAIGLRVRGLKRAGSGPS
jgi:hypothetical protein